MIEYNNTYYHHILGKPQLMAFIISTVELEVISVGIIGISF